MRWTDCVLAIAYLCILCQRQGVHRCRDLSLNFLFCSIDLYFCLCASTIPSWWLWLCNIVWVRNVDSYITLFSLNIALGIRGLWCFHTNCEIISCSSVKNTIGSSGLWWIYRLLWVVESFSLYWFFNPRTWYISPSICVIFDFFHQFFFYIFLYKGLLFLYVNLVLSILLFLLQWWMGLFP